MKLLTSLCYTSVFYAELMAPWVDEVCPEFLKVLDAPLVDMLL